MKAVTIYENYPNNIQQTKFTTENDKTEISLSLDTVLVNAQATKVLKLELGNNVGEPIESKTEVSLDLEQLMDILIAMKDLSALMQTK